LPLKVDLHTHTSDDPADAVPHSAQDLIDRASALGYDALAITLHDKRLDPRPLAAYAAERGIVLIPGIERTIDGRHVLLLNFSARAEEVNSFEEIAALKGEEGGIVVAPHPFFPLANCLGDVVDQHAELFDAVEINAMYVRGLDFNRKAIAWAAAHRKPLVGNGDVHRLTQLGSTYSLVDAAPTADAICTAIAAGRVHVRSVPMSWRRTLLTFADIVAAAVLTFVRRSVFGLADAPADAMNG
jgi:predicted metal-dependent phosphoesterase TrpH